MPRHPDRRTVLQTTGGLLAGATVFTGTSGALPDRPFRIDIRQESLNPNKKGVVPIEVAFPRDTFSGDVSFSEETFVGVHDDNDVPEEKAFQEEGEEVIIANDEAVATPEKVNDFGNPHDPTRRYVMTFDNEEILYPEGTLDDGLVTLGLGVFSDGTAVPDVSWATASCPGHRDY
ncbi:hypothetical protein [Natrinema sp. 1APR25-10V2]|uniref:hypothetical protein n=1 Tax=Natrinema sp. 1APR25-10V2 TaxID=2951081 RepID=UPI0028771971|nr:hypothetical protein [Natrinema sp. 1APR25-10V2]MDS0474901.1 hypothetical protein [Natrinema sp. 1APR25-10V2]